MGNCQSDHHHHHRPKDGNATQVATKDVASSYQKKKPQLTMTMMAEQSRVLSSSNTIVNNDASNNNVTSPMTKSPASSSSDDQNKTNTNTADMDQHTNKSPQPLSSQQLPSQADTGSHTFRSRTDRLKRKQQRRSTLRRSRVNSSASLGTIGAFDSKSFEFCLEDLLGVTASTELSVDPETTATTAATEGEVPSNKTANNNNINNLDLEDTLHMAQLLLETRQDEHDLTTDEVKAALLVYRELHRVLSVATRTGNLMKQPSSVDACGAKQTPFHDRFLALVQEMDQAQEALDKAMASPAAVKPVTAETLQEEVSDFFILDNSLRETTVGAAKGHTMEEKLRIVQSMAETGLEEVILGAFGAKVSVDSQIAAHWKRLGKSYDNAWGFSDVFDMQPIPDEEQEMLYKSIPDFLEKEARGEPVEFFTPSSGVLATYSKQEMALFKKASKGFQPHAFGGKSLDKVLKESQSIPKHGRIPLGLLMMAGYGICNAIIELDTSLETFDYEKYDIVERCTFLIQWIKDNFPKRQNVPPGQDNTARVFVTLRDFSNYNRSQAGSENALRLVHALSSLPPTKRPFGFMMEEPTGMLWPDEVGRLCRMIRLTMNRAGFPQGRFLVHIHWYMGLAETVQLACLCNGADGVWAAVCRAGAQLGHACSTMTAVNLLRAGLDEIPKQYNLEKMCKAAREVTEISTREKCPPHEEIYGEMAFDVPFMMTALPACRYMLAKLLKSLNIDQRVMRLNEISLPSAINKAMEYHFGKAEEIGWDPAHCPKMFSAIRDHLMTGLSRDYNTPLGLGHLYGLVSQEMLPPKMISIMMRGSSISDYHPAVLDFVDRWNRLCMKYEGLDVPPHPAARSKSVMMWGANLALEPLRKTLPFEFFLADVMRNPLMEPIPRLFKLQVLSLVTKNERELQGQKVPVIEFYETILRLKLFILEADSLGVMGLVDDFCIRKNHDYFFGEDHLWLQKVRGNKPKVMGKMMRQHIDFFPKFYIKQGNNALTRCVKAAAKRIEEKKGIDHDMYESFAEEGAIALKRVATLDDGSLRVSSRPSTFFADAHAQMLKDLAEDEGEDEEIAQHFLKENKALLGMDDDSVVSRPSLNNLGNVYVAESKRLSDESTFKQKDSGNSRDRQSLRLINSGLVSMRDKMKRTRRSKNEQASLNAVVEV